MNRERVTECVHAAVFIYRINNSFRKRKRFPQHRFIYIIWHEIISRHFASDFERSKNFHVGLGKRFCFVGFQLYSWLPAWFLILLPSLVYWNRRRYEADLVISWYFFCPVRIWPLFLFIRCSCGLLIPYLARIRCPKYRKIYGGVLFSSYISEQCAYLSLLKWLYHEF